MSESPIFDIIVIFATWYGVQKMKEKGFDPTPRSSNPVSPFSKDFSSPDVFREIWTALKRAIKFIDRLANGSDISFHRPSSSGFATLLPERFLSYIDTSFRGFVSSRGAEDFLPSYCPSIGGRADVSYAHRYDSVPAFWSVFSGWNSTVAIYVPVDFVFSHLATEIVGCYHVNDLLQNVPFVLTFGVVVVDRDLSISGSNYLEYFTADMHLRPSASLSGVHLLCSQRMVMPSVLYSVSSDDPPVETFNVYRQPFTISLVYPFKAVIPVVGTTPANCRLYFFSLLSPLVGVSRLPDMTLAMHFTTLGYLPNAAPLTWDLEY